MLDIMCSKGKDCLCARSLSAFDVSLNKIGASTGLAGIELLRESRSAELQDFSRCVRQDQSLREIGGSIRRSLIQISQCPGIGKTTLLGLLAMQYSDTLGEASNTEIIGSLVTFNGVHMAVNIADVSVEAALCIRVIYGALSCHSSCPGKACPNLFDLQRIARSAKNAEQVYGISVLSTRRALWKWFGPRPIFLGIDEALKCEDGTGGTDEKLKKLLTASGTFLDVGRDEPPVCVVLTALSPDSYMRASIASNRVIENILIYPSKLSAWPCFGLLHQRSL